MQRLKSVLLSMLGETWGNGPKFHEFLLECQKSSIFGRKACPLKDGREILAFPMHFNMALNKNCRTIN